MRFLQLALAIAVAATASTSEAGLQYCDHCGCQRHCKKVCRLVCGKKKEIKIEYECESEDFCLPGRSVKCGQVCERNRLGIKCCHAVLKPVCAQVRTRNVLVKKQSEKEVPDYNWVVEKVCCHCGQKIKDGEESGDGKDGREGKSVGRHVGRPSRPSMAGGLEGRPTTNARLIHSRAQYKTVSAEEESEQALPEGDYEALASDSDGETTAVETPKRRGWLQTLFGKK
ncbi:MAG TPA: hypothetical protein VMV10_30035 [Pirellulales bacterium]|nr:hypothetical protein [Pirellulales bacterium]